MLTRECGAVRNEALESFSKRPIAWCSFHNTKLAAGTEDAARLAGRRLYVQIDFEPKSAPRLPISLALSTFSATGEVKSHIGTFFDVGVGQLEASIYVPEDASSVYWIVSGSSYQAENASLAIRNAQAFVSEARYQPGEMCAPCRQYLDEAIERVGKEFLFADRLQLQDLAKALRIAATGAQDIAEMDGTMKELSRKINEATIAAGMLPHGLFQSKTEFAANVSKMPPGGAQQQASGPTAPPLFDARLLEKRIGYIRLRSFLQSEPAQGSAYAHALSEAVAGLHQQGADQWVLDLREHGGGTLFPAIAALRPLLGNGAVGHFIDANGKPHTPWLWGAPGGPGETEDAASGAKNPAFDGERQAIAVLLGPKTASSGEMLAIAFHGRANSRSFGAPSAGFTSVVSGMPDRYGNFFGFVSAYAADRNGQRIFPKVVPDVAAGNGEAPGQPDPALGAATQWLGEMRATIAPP